MEAYRPLCESDWEQYRDLIEYCHGRTPKPEAPYARGLFTQEGLASVLWLIPFELWVDGVKLKMGGIANVATAAENRRRGYVSKLMRHSLQEMYENGMAFSLLYPFNQEFYRRYGWEVAIFDVEHVIPVKELHYFRQTGHVKRYPVNQPPPEAWQLYDTFAHNRRGYAVRSSAAHWHDHVVFCCGIDQKVIFTVWAPNPESPPEGYLIYRLDRGREQLCVHELVATTPAAWYGLWAYLAVHDSPPVENVIFTSLPSFPLNHIVPGLFQIKSTVRPRHMMRIVNLEKAFGDRPWPKSVSGSIYLQVRDDTAAWNRGSWRLDFAGGKCAIVREPKGSADITLDITTLAQLYTGHLTLRDAERTGLISVSSQPAYQLLTTALIGEPWFIYEMF